MDGGERRKPLWIDGAAGGLLPLLADRKAERAHALLKAVAAISMPMPTRASPGFYEADPLTGAPAPLAEVACWAHARRKIYDIPCRNEIVRGGACARDESRGCL